MSDTETTEIPMAQPVDQAGQPSEEAKPKRSRRKKEADTSFDPAQFGGQPTDGVTAETVNGEAVQEERKAVSYAAIVTDPGARMRFHFNYDARPQLAAITFDDGKPSDEVRQALREGGYRWNNEALAWEIPILFESREQDRQHARRVFNEVAEMRREEFGVGQSVAG